MSVPAIALYASPPGGVCSSSSIGASSSSSSHGGSPDSDLNPRLPSSAQRPITGGLSCLFASPSVRHVSAGFPGACDDPWHDRPDDLASSSSYSASLKFREQSPVSVFHAPVSCSSGRGGSALSKSSHSFRVAWSGEGLRAGRERERDRLFSGFIRNALGSCLDYESPSISIRGDVAVDVEELSFNLDEGLVDPVCKPYARDLLLGAQARHKIFYEEVVVKAFYEAEKAHRGQMRASGDPYLEHCVETAVLLAKIGANVTVVAAGILHDTLDDSFICYDYIFGAFGTGVADLVEGVSKLSQLSKLARDSNTATRTVEADRLHTMFLAMADARAVLIKLADRLHNMLTLDALPIAKQQRFAKETLEIFVPLANRLGISSWKQQLENLCFKHLHPEMYRELSSKLINSFDETMIAATIKKLEEGLRNEGVSYHVLSGRYKSLYSIYSKMLKKKLTVDEIHDIHGIRLIVENEEECYRALHVVHQLWPEVVGKLKDYITHPKFNGYRSLHAVVVSGELPLEVQIRTREMHLQAEFGFAAHWRYKEAECKHSAFVLQMVEWARWVVTWQCETMNQGRPSSCGDSSLIRPPCPFPSHSDDCPYSYTRQCDHDGPIFIILLENDKMSVQEFPADSTVMDLLERTGRCNSRWLRYNFPIKEELRPRLNQEPVDNPRQKLKMGDVVEMTPAIPDKSLTEYRVEIQRMYDQGLPAPSQAGWRR